MMNQFFRAPAVLARLCVGPLGPHMDSLTRLLSEQDYAKLRAVSSLSHWLEQQALGIDELDEEVVARFLEQQPRNHVARKSRVAFKILLEHLREAEVVPAKQESPPSALDEALREFTQYLTRGQLWTHPADASSEVASRLDDEMVFSGDIGEMLLLAHERPCVTDRGGVRQALADLRYRRPPLGI